MDFQHFTLKRLTPDDISLLRQLNALFGNAFSDPGAYGSEPPTDVYLRGILAKDHIVALVVSPAGSSPTNSTSLSRRGVSSISTTSRLTKTIAVRE